MGLGQLIAGLLLMTQRYAKLGALMFLPIITNVFIFTLSYDFRGTPIITGLMLAANIILVLWDWDELKILVNKTPEIQPLNRFEHFRIWEITGLVLFLFTATYRAIGTGYSILHWAGVCSAIGLTGLILGIYKLRKELNDKI